MRRGFATTANPPRGGLLSLEPRVQILSLRTGASDIFLQVTRADDDDILPSRLKKLV